MIIMLTRDIIILDTIKEFVPYYSRSRSRIISL